MSRPLTLPLVVMLCAAACGGDPPNVDGWPDAAADVASAADGSDVLDGQVIDVAAPLDAPDAAMDARPDVGDGAPVADRAASDPCRGACSFGEMCVRGSCLFVCGAANHYLCGGACVDITTNMESCGVCGHACVPNESTVRCIAGECRVLSCTTGRADCDGDASNGCEVLLSNSATNCGACGHACPAATRGRGVCSMGACALACDAGFGDCDGYTANGCEADLRRDPRNCGACSRGCGPSQTCVPTPGGPEPGACRPM